jgi:hypothetical protein
MMSSNSPPISGGPAPSLGGTKQDPKEESGTHPYVEPNKKNQERLGSHEYDHGDAPELDSSEEKEKSRSYLILLLVVP